MSGKRRASSNTIEILSLIVALLLVLLIATFSYRAWAAFRRESTELATATQIVNETNTLLSSLKDAETGQRGFLLTGEERYLAPYQAAEASVPLTLKALSAAVAAIPDQAERVSQLPPLAREKMDELAQTIALQRSHHLDSALELVRTDRGRALMDQIRALGDAIQLSANHRLTQFAGQSRASANQLGLIATLGSAMLFVLLSLATITLQRNSIRRERLMEALTLSEEQARQARDWLQTTLVSIGDGVIATDAKGNVVFLNPIAQALTGWTEAEAIGLALEKIFVISNENTGAPVENPVRKALREGAIVALANHTALTAKDGRSIAIDDTAAPIRSPKGPVVGVVLVFRDVTVAREKERQQERSRSALASANKDLQQFGYAASHDLREPLRTIKIFAQMLEQEASSWTETQRGHLKLIIGGTDRMEQLVNALLEYSTAGVATDQPLTEISVEQVLAGTLDNLRAAVEESHAVITQDALPWIMAEPAHIGVVFQNLIGNAIKYRDREPPRIHVSAKKSGDEWIFSVADNGLGIGPEYHAAIFDIFKRLHTQNLSGSGIGLATCRRIVQRYHGRIWVESELGKGSTFFFSLPMRAARGAAHSETARADKSL